MSKKIISVIAVCLLFSVFALNGQDLGEFYSHKKSILGTKVGISTFHCTSPAYERIYPNNEAFAPTYNNLILPVLLVIEIPEVVSNRQWGYHLQGDVLIGEDVWGAIFSTLRKKRTEHALSNFSEFRNGVNFYTTERLAVRGGIGVGIWWFSAKMSDYDPNRNPMAYNDFPFTIGPYAGADFAINSWLAARFSTELAMGIILDNNGSGKQKYPSPPIWINNFELCTKYGLYIGYDIYYMPKINDYKYNNTTSALEKIGTSFKYIRTDLSIGWKYKIPSRRATYTIKGHKSK